MVHKGTFMNIVDTDVKHLRVGTLKLEVYPNRKAAGAAASQAAAVALKELGLDRGSIGVIFATGASQVDTLVALPEIEGLPWERVRGFHMDEYIGIDPEHSASF